MHIISYLHCIIKWQSLGLYLIYILYCGWLTFHVWWFWVYMYTSVYIYTYMHSDKIEMDGWMDRWIDRYIRWHHINIYIYIIHIHAMTPYSVSVVLPRVETSGGPDAPSTPCAACAEAPKRSPKRVVAAASGRHWLYPPVISYIAMEAMDHRNGWFTYEKWWFSIVMLVYWRVSISI